MTDAWASMGRSLVEDAYASVKGRVRTRVVHEQLRRHLPLPPGRVLDVGGGAGHQSYPLARLGYEVTLLDASASMLARAEERLGHEPPEVRRLVTLVEGPGERAQDLCGTGFSAVLCHGVLMYLDEPGPLVRSLCACTAPGGIVSLLVLNAAAMAVRPALERRFADALSSFEARREQGVLGTGTRADALEEVEALLGANGTVPEAWYGVWLFSDWLDLAGVPLPGDDLDGIVEVELAASRRDPYRRLSRLLHVLGRRGETST